MTSSRFSTFLLAAAFIAAGSAAEARHRSTTSEAGSTPASSKADASTGKPVQVGSFGDWKSFVAKGKSKTCYVLATPSERKPTGKKETAYVFIADRPAEKVHNEVSIMMGFPIKENGTAQAKVGATTFDLVAKGSNAWIKDPADESKFVDSLKHAGKLLVKVAAVKGPVTSDTYALGGLKQALDLVGKSCR